MFTIGMSWRTKVLLFISTRKVWTEKSSWREMCLIQLQSRLGGLVCLFVCFFFWLFLFGFLFCFALFLCSLVLFWFFFCLLSFRVVSVLIFDLVFCFCCFTSLFFFFFVCRKENNSMFRESLLVLKTHCIKTYTLLPCFALCLILLR